MLRSNFSSFPQSFYLLLGFNNKTGTRFSLRDKQLLEIRKVKTMGVDCTFTWCLRLAVVCDGGLS